MYKPAITPLTRRPLKDRIISYIRAVAQDYNLDDRILIKQCETESSFDPRAKNFKSGALGLFQLLPTTAFELGYSTEDLTNPYRNILAACEYIDWLMARPIINQDYIKMLAAYNWGIGHLTDLLNSNPEDWFSKLPVDVQSYVRKILGETKS